MRWKTEILYINVCGNRTHLDWPRWLSKLYTQKHTEIINFELRSQIRTHTIWCNWHSFLIARNPIYTARLQPIWSTIEINMKNSRYADAVHPIYYAHSSVMLCLVAVMLTFTEDWWGLFTHIIHRDSIFSSTGSIILMRVPLKWPWRVCVKLIIYSRVLLREANPSYCM